VSFVSESLQNLNEIDNGTLYLNIRKIIKLSINVKVLST